MNLLQLHLVRIIRLLAGTAMLIYGFSSGQYLLAGMGGIIFLLGILNIGCPFNSCGIPQDKSGNKTEEIEYEEVSK